MATLTFYTHPFSRSRVTRWMLEETGLPYDEVVLDFATTMKAPEYLAVNPMGKVPALRHDGVVVTENAAICLHLAELAPEKGLLPPPGSPERGAATAGCCSPPVRWRPSSPRAGTVRWRRRGRRATATRPT